MNFINSVQSEWTKKRRSAVSWLTLVGGLFIPAIILIARLIQHSQTLMGNSTEGIWMKLFDQCWQFMSVFLLPMGITLAASLITQIEYRNNSWKQVYASPQTLSTIFWSKYIVVFAVLLQFFILFTVGIYLTGLIPSIIYSDVPYPKESFPFFGFLKGNLEFFIDCLPILALQYLLSLHLKNFMISIGAGFALLVASLIGMNWKYGFILPYTYGSLQFLHADNKLSSTVNIQAWAIGYFLLFTLLNYFLFIYKSQSKLSVQIDKYILGKKKRLALLGAFLLILSATAVFYFNRNQPQKTRLISASEIESRIKSVEQNLGAFIIPNVNEWTIAERMRHYKVKGLSIAVVNNFKIEWAKGYGLADSSENRFVDANTPFIPGSLSKSINAMGLLKLVQDKKIDLFDDINNYLTSWKFPYDTTSKNRKITLANLLSHSAGLNVHGFYGYKNGDSLPTIVQILNGKKPANSEPVKSIFQPGLKMEYSGGGSIISQLMLMDISKQAYDQYLYNNVLKPIGMTNSFFTQPSPLTKKKLLATGYDSLGNEVKGKYPILMEQAAAGLWTTPTDMCKYIIEVQLSLKGESNKILSKQMTDLMLTPYIDERAALGVFIDNNQGYKYFGHEAGNVGFSGAFYGSIEDGNGVAVFINSENSDILKEVVNSVIEVYRWNGFSKKEVKKIISLSDTIFKKYIGLYEAKDEKENITKVIISKKKNEFYYNVNNQNRKMYFTSTTEFINNENPSEKSFKLDKEGNIVGLNISYLGKTLYFKKNKQ
jgi:CubicO group peptidase (beta-lactamase class C family)